MTSEVSNILEPIPEEDFDSGAAYTKKLEQMRNANAVAR